MAQLILGPLLRYVGAREATVWVETDQPTEVEILGHRARTFHVAGHHYALVVIEGLEPGESREYSVALDGEHRWPEPLSSLPPSRIRTLHPERAVNVAFGSCRVAAEHNPRHALPQTEGARDPDVDALQALARRLAGQAEDDWPSLLLMLGDQVYGDDVSPRTLEFIRSRRSTQEPPGEGVADFEEYTQLYREAWDERLIRWLLATVPSAMIFDDHEVIDDWNISAAWKQEVRALTWWPDRIAGAFMSYWLYQHLGNLAPEELRDDELYRQARAVDDAAPLLRSIALEADRTTAGSRWSYARQLGRSRLVVIDSRAGRLLTGGRREMVDDDEWRWIDQQLHGDVDHLLVATSVPFLLPRSIHELEGWDEALAEGAWGALAARFGERLRRAIDLEHWAAFRSSFERMARVLRDVAAGRRGAAPASIILLSGDVHYAYLAEAGFPGQPVACRIYQAVCSPFQHRLDPPLELANRVAFSRAAARIGMLLARAARVSPPSIAWRMTHGPYFNNEVATLELIGDGARLRFERTPTAQLQLECVLDAKLS